MVVSAATRSRLRTIAFTPSSQQSRARAVGGRIDARGVPASADCPMSMATSWPTRHSSFSMALIAVVPHGTHTAPTDNAIPFHADTPTDGERHEPHGRHAPPEKRKATTAMRPARAMGFYDPSYRASQSHIRPISGMAFFSLFAWPVSKVDRDPSLAFGGRGYPRLANLHGACFPACNFSGCRWSRGGVRGSPRGPFAPPDACYAVASR